MYNYSNGFKDQFSEISGSSGEVFICQILMFTKYMTKSVRDESKTQVSVSYEELCGITGLFEVYFIKSASTAQSNTKPV